MSNCENSASTSKRVSLRENRGNRAKISRTLTLENLKGPLDNPRSIASLILYYLFLNKVKINYEEEREVIIYRLLQNKTSLEVESENFNFFFNEVAEICKLDGRTGKEASLKWFVLRTCIKLPFVSEYKQKWKCLRIMCKIRSITNIYTEGNNCDKMNQCR